MPQFERLNQIGSVNLNVLQSNALLICLLVMLICNYSFLAISSGIVYGYYAMILKVDEEEYGGHGTLLQEGLFASTTLFLVA